MASVIRKGDIEMRTSVAQAYLPKEFEDLERFCPEWLRLTERERNLKRVNSTMEELNDFYNTMMPRLESIASYLDKYPIHAMPRRPGNLLLLALMAMEAAPAVEYLSSPDVPKSFPHERFQILPLPPRFRIVDEPAQTVD